MAASRRGCSPGSTLGPSAAYTTYNSLGTSGTDGATTAVGSMSIVCFSCHDGASSMNMVINTPESGSMTRIDSWSGKAAPVTVGSSMPVWPNPGQDSRNDHPIGNPYGGGLRSGTVPTMGSGSNTYVNLLFRNTDFRSASGTLVNGKPVWWIDTGTGGSGTREKTDIQLHTRSHVVVVTGGETHTVMEPVVECASCHDPHTSNVIFQRIPNTGSALCLTCHALGNF